jgi:hypothetical protein
MRTWEYTVEFFDWDEAQLQLDELGANGWELVAIHNDPDCLERFIFKRPRVLEEVDVPFLDQISEAPLLPQLTDDERTAARREHLRDYSVERLRAMASDASLAPETRDGAKDELQSRV